MLPDAGATFRLVFLFFLRRMKKKMPKPIRARPTRGPTTAPAIQALLSLFSSPAGGEEEGVEPPVGVDVDEAGVGTGIPAMEAAPGLCVSTWIWSCMKVLYLKMRRPMQQRMMRPT
jgi:hypothetical protein